ncbi:putative N-acetylglucosaminyl-phosphatidylinositol de-N-acetylase [Paratrimastix pyriformis]|uniref:N-acetylglucosaminylphosphatidylinositol deacetylase n=1 Tax=Paratrimastix pyriformis TaxID=342808 RepID=A0ABQ8UF72_9EUKA|nr:putative N-acetylglucosaminyl-phosphatidylinositol de-N-acetylase [Paratrimastix pyriformis]
MSAKQLFASAFVAVLASIIIWYSQTGSQSWSSSGLPRNQRILLVTAHPDDDAMFFSPTLTALAERNNTLSIFCLSSGTFRDQKGFHTETGFTRQRELQRSCQLYHIPPERCLTGDSLLALNQTDPAARVALAKLGVHCAENSHPSLFLDGFKERWAPVRVASAVRFVVERLGADALVTFDDHGVSEHPNHIAVSRGTRAAFDKVMSHVHIRRTGANITPRQSPPPPEDGSVGSALHIRSQAASGQAWRAMWQCYRSQQVWYRWLYLAFSRYTTTNLLWRLA